MFQFIIVIIVGIMTFTAVSGIFVLTNILSLDHNYTEIRDSAVENKLDTNEIASTGNNSISDSNSDYYNKEFYSTNKQQNNNLLVATNSINKIQVNTYENQKTILNNLSKQSILLNKINGLRAPPFLI